MQSANLSREVMSSPKVSVVHAESGELPPLEFRQAAGVQADVHATHARPAFSTNGRAA
jgi:hypothetical protein